MGDAIASTSDEKGTTDEQKEKQKTYCVRAHIET